MSKKYDVNGLEYKKVKGKVRVLKVVRYETCPIYIRMVGNDMFMYDLVFGGEIYSSYIIITPSMGKLSLTKDQISQAGALILTGALATIDTLLGIEVSDEAKEKVELFESVRESVEKMEES